MTINLADRKRAEIEEFEVMPQSDKASTPTLRITASAGISSVVDKANNGFDSVEVAEKALQQANVQGLNKVYTLDPADIESIGDMTEAIAA